MRALELFTIFVVAACINGNITRFVDWPDWKSLPVCARDPIEFGVFSVLKCGISPLCVCDRYSEGLSIVESIAITKSNCPATGVSSASSLFSAFCHQLPSVTVFGTDVASSPTSASPLPTQTNIPPTTSPTLSSGSGNIIPNASNCSLISARRNCRFVFGSSWNR